MQEITFLAYDTVCRVAADLAPGQEHVFARVQESAREVEARLSMFDPAQRTVPPVPGLYARHSGPGFRSVV